MTRLKQPTQDEWNDIFNSIIIDSEPPMEYVTNGVIPTKTGTCFTVDPIDFETILEREELLGPENSMLAACRLTLNIPKLKRDVSKWTNELLGSFDKTMAAPVPKFKRAQNPKN